MIIESHISKILEHFFFKWLLKQDLERFQINEVVSVHYNAELDQEVLFCGVLLEIAAKVDLLSVVSFGVLDSKLQQSSQTHSEPAEVTTHLPWELVLVKGYLHLAVPIIGS